MLTEYQDTKACRRSVTKSTKQRVERPIKVGLYLQLDAARRLVVTATKEGLDRSQIVNEFVRIHRRKYIVQVRSERPSGEASSGAEAAPPELGGRACWRVVCTVQFFGKNLQRHRLMRLQGAV